MVDVRFELTTTDPWSVDDAICEGISPVGYWQKVNQSSTQSKSHDTLPPFEQRDAICEGISPLGYWQKVNQSPTQTKPYNTLPPFEHRDSWSSYGAVRAYSEVLF